MKHLIKSKELETFDIHEEAFELIWYDDESLEITHEKVYGKLKEE